MSETKKRDRTDPTTSGDGEMSKKPRINGLSSITSQSNKDRVAEAKARVASLALKNRVADNKKENNGGPSNGGNVKTGSTTTDLMAKIRERKAQLEALNKKREAVSDLAQQTKLPPQHVPTPPNRQPAPPSRPRGPGLNTPIHPLLLETKTSRPTAVDLSRPNIYLSLDEDKKPPSSPVPTNNPYFDPEVSTKTNFDTRRKRGLAFNPQGKFIKKADEERKQIQLEILKKKIEEAKYKASVAGLSDADILAGERSFKPSPPPLIEWWDESIVTNPSHGYTEGVDSDPTQNPKILSSENNPITLFIQHPIPINPPWEKNLPKQTRLHLTKREIKRMRKNDRAERHKEAQDRIRLGLDPAPPPKIKPSNVMSVFANEAIKDPTLMELRAKTEVAQRKQKHEQENQTRKLTSEQQYEKWVAKSEREKAKGIYCAAFRIDILSDGRHKFLVNYNAKHLQLTGMTIFNEKFCLVVVEGGFLNIKKFSKLVLNRIHWTENAPPRPTDSDSPPEPPVDLTSNRCVLVWYGQIKTSRFQKWSLHDAETEQDAKDMLSRHNSEQFWVEARLL